MEWLDARWPWEYPDGRIEVRPDGTALPCVPYDRLAVIGHGEVIDHNLTAIGSTQP
jgi:hypothetical protein